MSEFAEAAKRLNVASPSQIQTMMVNADPTKVEATLGEKSCYSLFRNKRIMLDEMT